MKTITLFFASLAWAAAPLAAQVSLELDSLDPNRKAAYADALASFQKEKMRSDEERERINSELVKMRSELDRARTDGEKIKAFEKNVQLLERNQRLADERTQSVYTRNYFIAVGEVILMEEDIKPVNLLQKAEDFFSSVSTAGNPMNYKDYADFMTEFQSFLKKDRTGSPVLQAIDESLKFAQGFMGGGGNSGSGGGGVMGKVSSVVSAAGPLFNTIISGITSVLSNTKEKALRDKGRPALEIASIVGQYSYEISMIQEEWAAIGEELRLLKDSREKLIQENLRILNIGDSDFQRNYVNETVHIKKSNYLQTTVKQRVENVVAKAKADNPNNWKTEFHNQMESVKSLKVRFGQLTLRILNNIKSYERILDKFKDTLMKDRIAQLRPKLESLRNTFRDDFRPEQYIQGAATMYEVE